jgi:hypothetical protein
MGALLAVPLAVGLVIALVGAVPAGMAATPTPTPATGTAPITVVIPSDASPSPSPSSSHGGGGSGGGSSGGDGSTGGNGSGGGGAHNADGSPIPPSGPKDGAPKLRLDKERGEAGDWVIAIASGYKPGERAQVVLYPGAVVIGSFVVGADGKFTARFRIPPDTRTGAAVVEVTGWESGFVTNAGLTVVTAAAPSNWLMLWWVYLVLAVVLIGLISLSIAFRSDIARWFGAPRRAGA